MPDNIIRSLIAAGPAICMFTLPAHAHLGHAGDLAGHSHWVGLGALGVAVAIAAAAALLPKKKQTGAEEQETGETADGETEEEAV